MSHYRYIQSNFSKLSTIGYGCMVNKNNVEGEKHSHYWYECNVILDGAVTDTVDGIETLVSKGECAVYAPGEFHQTKNAGETIAHILTIMAIPEEMDKLSLIYGKSLKENFSAKNTRKITLSSEEMNLLEADYHQLYFLDEQSRENHEKILFLHIVSCIMRRTGTKQISHAHPNMEEALRNMNNISNLSEGFSALLRLSKMSRAQLYRYMKKYYNCTPLDYITDLRMRYAASRLVYTNNSILSICMDIGYFSESHFISVFKEHFGISPLKYRRLNSANTSYIPT